MLQLKNFLLSKEINWKRVWLLVMIGYVVFISATCSYYGSTRKWVNIDGYDYEWQDVIDGNLL